MELMSFGRIAAIFEQSLVQLYDTEGCYSLVEEFIWNSDLLFVIFLRSSTGYVRRCKERRTPVACADSHRSYVRAMTCISTPLTRR